MANFRLTRFRFWFTYFLVVAIVVFVILEVMVRLLQFAQPLAKNFNTIEDIYLPWKPRPLSVTSGSTSEFDYEYKHNSFGFRDVEHTLTKPQGVFRILGVGDSFTYGDGIPFEGTYLFKLEKLLNRREGEHPKIEIIKAGIYRFFPEPERLLIKHYGVKFSPDLVLVAFVPNDVGDTNVGIDFMKVHKSGYLQTREGAELGEVAKFLFIHSHVFRIMLTKYIAYMINRKYPQKWPDVYKPNGFYEKDWKRVESEYEKMIKIARSIKASIVFLHIPQKGPWEKRHSYPATRLSQWSVQHGVYFIDTLPAIKKGSENELLYYEMDGHCRPSGHRVIAGVLFKELVEKKIIP